MRFNIGFLGNLAPCGADGRAGGERSPGWVDLLTHGTPQASFARQSSAIKLLNKKNIINSL